MSYFDDNEDRIIYGGARRVRTPAPTPAAAPVCPYCGKSARKVTGKQLYPHRRDLHGLTFWDCRPCDAYVGCHRGGRGDAPLGRLANAELRAAKGVAHAAFDPLWKNGARTRSAAYAWLADQLQIPAADCHIGMFDVDTCRRAVDICRADDFEALA